MRPRLIPPSHLHAVRRRPLAASPQPLRRPSFKPSGQHRQFHAVEILDATQSFILGLHSTTSLPWYLTLPLLALIVRGAVTLPFTVYAQTRGIKTVQLAPVLQAWQKRIAREEAQDRTKHPTAESFTKTVQQRFVKKRKEIYKRNGIQYWKNFTGVAVQMPIWMIVVLSLRRMTAIGGGLGSSFFQEASTKENGEAATTTPSGTENSIEQLDIASSSISDNISDLAAGGTIPSSNMQEINNTLQTDFPSLFVNDKFTKLDPELLHSFQTEGIPGWCLNLLEMDQTTILPVIFAASILANIEFQTLSRGNQEVTGWRKWFRYLLRGLTVPILWISLSVESFILIYWASSAMISLIQNVLINQYLPFPKVIAPLKPKPLPLAAKYGGMAGAVEIDRKSIVDEYFARRKAVTERRTKQESIEKESKRIADIVKVANEKVKGRSIGIGASTGKQNTKVKER